MQKFHKPVDLLCSIHTDQRITGQDLLTAFQSSPRIDAVQVPSGMDDRDDISAVLVTLTDEERAELGIPKLREPLQPSPSPPESPVPSSPHPVYHVRVHAILCANDDGSGGASEPNAVDGNFIQRLLNGMNSIFHAAGIQFLFDPVADFERVNSSLLNLDYFVPSDLNLDAPESQPPLTKAQVEELTKPNTEERQRVGRQHPHKLLLLFCDGNSLIYDQSAKRWASIPRTYAFSGGDLEFVALPTGTGDLEGWARLASHETGHYFHRVHPHWYPEPDDPIHGDRTLCLTIQEASKVTTTQGEWRWCRKCQGLFFAGAGLGTCPAGGQHDPTGSGDYRLIGAAASSEGQADWHWCRKCNGLFFTKRNLGKCPSGGRHDCTGSGGYRLLTRTSTAFDLAKDCQNNWRWCRKCQGLFFAGDSHGVCPAGGSHDPSGSGDYKVVDNLTQKIGAALIERAAENIRYYVEQGNPRARGQYIFDGDGLEGTPPDPGPTMFLYVNGDACGGPDAIAVQAFPDYPPYVLKPDRHNIMGYYGGCMKLDMHFVQEQIMGMRLVIERYNRRHLCPPCHSDRATITYFDGHQQRLYVFVEGGFEHLRVNWWDGLQWQWADQGAPPGTMLVGNPATITFFDEEQLHYVFVTGGNGHLLVNWWDGAQWQWADQGTPPRTTVYGSPATITFFNGQQQAIYAFVRGANGHLYTNWWDGGQWQWADQGTPSGTAVTNDPGTLTFFDGRQQLIYVFVQGANGHLCVNWWDGQQWQWADQGTPPGTTVHSPPETITFFDGQVQRLYAFVRGANGHLYANWWDGAQWQWADQGTPPGAKVYGTPATITFFDGQVQRLYAFVRGDNWRLYVNWWDGQQWQWADQGTPPGTSVLGLPETLTFFDGRQQLIYVFVQGSDKHLYVNWWDGGQWQWADRGAVAG